MPGVPDEAAGIPLRGRLEPGAEGRSILPLWGQFRPGRVETLFFLHVLFESSPQRKDTPPLQNAAA